MKKSIKIGNRLISENSPCYIVAEMSGNHNMDFNRAKEIIYRAYKAGADAVKIRHIYADTILLIATMNIFK